MKEKTLDGFLNINKPQEMTSFDVVAILRKILGVKKIGHLGTLDPMAEGVLPIAVGRATRLIEYIDDGSKVYDAEFIFGIRTDTDDIWGKEIEQAENTRESVTKEDIEDLLPRFTGEITQIPPKYSAVKVGGKKLYEYARKGQDVSAGERRVVIKDIEDKKWKRTDDYLDEFDYLISAGIALEVKAISKPSYPLAENSGKNLLKLYLNDVGILSCIFYRNNIKAIMSDIKSINLGSVYETVVAQELKAHGYVLYYYDNKKNGEVDYLIDDVDNLSNIPIEVKSGKDYTVHSALDKFLSIEEYNIKKAYVLSNEQRVYTQNGITYIPIYYIMFFQNVSNVVEQFLD